MKKTAFIFLIILLLSFFLICLSQYSNYRKYKTNEVFSFVNVLDEVIDVYFSTYLKYPTNGNELIGFLKKDNTFYLQYNLEIPKIFLKQGLGIHIDKELKNIYIYSFGKNQIDEKDTSFINLSEMNFWDYLFVKKDILLITTKTTGLCHTHPWVIKFFSKGNPIENTELKKKLRRDIKRFIIRNTPQISGKYKLVNPKEYYFKGVKTKKKFKLSTICFSGEEKNNIPIYDSLQSILNNIFNQNEIDEVYFPFKTYERILY